MKDTSPQAIPFRQHHYTGNEVRYMQEAMNRQHLSGDGGFSEKCQRYFSDHYGFSDSLLTTSGSSALELAALLLDLQPGDEVILPSFTFVATANAFAMRGAALRFADSAPDFPGMDLAHVQQLISPRTKVIVAVHYAGYDQDIVALKAICQQHNLVLIEDAAQALGSVSAEGKPLGSYGDLAIFSFHESKNIHCGEGGLLVINRPEWYRKARIIREKGTNRFEFFEQTVSFYEWQAIGSAYQLSDLQAAFLLAQLEDYQQVVSKRTALWQRYYQNLEPLKIAQAIGIMPAAYQLLGNASIFYVVVNSKGERQWLQQFLNEKGIATAIHYVALHTSVYYRTHYKTLHLPQAERYTDCLLRLPLYPGLTVSQVDFICNGIKEFYEQKA